MQTVFSVATLATVASAIEISMINPFFDKPASDGPMILSMANPFTEETYGQTSATGARPTGLDMPNPFDQGFRNIPVGEVNYIRPKGELPTKFPTKVTVPEMLGASKPQFIEDRDDRMLISEP